MVLLHGGSGVGGFSLKPFEALGDDRPVIGYDQLGAGKSDRVIDTPLMKIPHFVAEDDSLGRAIGVEYGQSWGTVLTLEYDRAHREHVTGIATSTYTYLQGAYEFVVTGALRRYDGTARLPTIRVATLVTADESNEVEPWTAGAHARRIPGARFTLHKGATHLTSWDSRDANVVDVRAFRRAAEARR